MPVIFISGYGRDETIVRALEAGAADYIVKPFSPTELVARIRAALRQREEPEPYVLWEIFRLTTDVDGCALQGARWTLRPQSSIFCTFSRQTQVGS